ncbi:MAG: hypothetical protein V1742_05310 [Pseudomonadota bacterium]
MDPVIYDQVTTNKELDREHDDTDREIGEAVEFGRFSPGSGELGEEDFERAVGGDDSVTFSDYEIIDRWNDVV